MEEETIDLPADNIEDKKEKIRKLVEEGYTNREIADLMKHSRSCKIEECTKYKKGARLKKKDMEE